MLVTGRILNAEPLMSRTYTTQTGEQRVANERKVHFSFGTGSFLGTMIGDNATRWVHEHDWRNFSLWACEFNVTSRDYVKDGQKMVFNDIPISKLVPLT